MPSIILTPRRSFHDISIGDEKQEATLLNRLASKSALLPDAARTDVRQRSLILRISMKQIGLLRGKFRVFVVLCLIARSVAGSSLHQQ